MVDHARTCVCCDGPAAAVIDVAPDIAMAMCRQHVAKRLRVEAKDRAAALLAEYVTACRFGR